MSKDRDSYTWSDASSDLAYLTPLTLMQAHRVSEAMAAWGLNPYDSLHALKFIYSGEGPHKITEGLTYILDLARNNSS